MTDKSEECCPEFDPEKWDKKTFVWDDKQFIKESVPALFHMPFSPMIGKKIIRMMSFATNADKIDSKKDEVLILFQDPNPFKSNIYISVTGNVPKANNVGISGKFVAKVYDGPYKAIPKYVKNMNSYLEKEGKKIPSDSDYYIHYAYCPKCEKKFGHHYMVFFAKV